MPCIHLQNEKLKNLDIHDSHQLTNFASVSENIYIYLREGGSQISRANPCQTGAEYRAKNREIKWDKSDEEFESFQKEHEFVLDNYRQYIIEQLKLCPQINHTLFRKFPCIFLP